MLREADTVGRQPVEVGRSNDFLPVGAELIVPKIVGQNVDDVGCAFFGGAAGQKDACEQQREQTIHEPLVVIRSVRRMAAVIGPNLMKMNGDETLETKKPRPTCVDRGAFGGPDETRTRDLLRDRQAF